MLCAALPVTGRVTSPFGWRQLNGRSDLHTGVDLGAPEGSPVWAMLPGDVVVSAPSGQLSGYGNVVVLRHAAALFTLYAHLSARSVAVGQHVDAGALLGAVGRTAGTHEDPQRMFGTSGAHLHLEFLSRWPPAGRDLDRLDPGPLFAQLGIMVPSSGPLQRACMLPSSSSPAAAAVFAASSSAVQLTQRPPARAAMGGLLALAVVWGVVKSKRR